MILLWLDFNCLNFKTFSYPYIRPNPVQSFCLSFCFPHNLKWSKMVINEPVLLARHLLNQFVVKLSNKFKFKFKLSNTLACQRHRRAILEHSGLPAGRPQTAECRAAVHTWAEQPIQMQKAQLLAELAMSRWDDHNNIRCGDKIEMV